MGCNWGGKYANIPRVYTGKSLDASRPPALIDTLKRKWAHLLRAEVSWPRTENSQLSVSMAMPFFLALVCKSAVRNPCEAHTIKAGVSAYSSTMFLLLHALCVGGLNCRRVSSILSEARWPYIFCVCWDLIVQQKYQAPINAVHNDKCAGMGASTGTTRKRISSGKDTKYYTKKTPPFVLIVQSFLVLFGSPL